MKTIKGDLVLKKDTTFKESIKVEGNIKGLYNLKVYGNINTLNIDALNIDAWNIDAVDIGAMNIDAMNIDAGNIDARNIVAVDINAGNIIFCEKRIKKTKTAVTKARVFVDGRSKLEVKEWLVKK